MIVDRFTKPDLRGCYGLTDLEIVEPGASQRPSSQDRPVDRAAPRGPAAGNTHNHTGAMIPIDSTGQVGLTQGHPRFAPMADHHQTSERSACPASGDRYRRNTQMRLEQMEPPAGY